jgi:transketolase
MGSIANGMAAHGGTLPFCSTFLIFSDYMRPPMRLASLMNLRVIYAFTHDSIALGEDGPTHQPVEQLLGLRSIPGFVLLRPADANETAACWKIIVGMRAGPAAIVLTRQKLPVLDPSRYPALKTGVARGAYVLAAEEPAGEKPRLVMAATGSEVHLALAARELLARDGVPARVVSMPCWKLFERQDGDYRAEVFPPGVPVLAVEAGVSLGWRSYLGDGAATVSVDRFGASAPGEELLEHYGMTAMSVYEAAKSLADAAAKGEPSGNGTQQPSYKA